MPEGRPAQAGILEFVRINARDRQAGAASVSGVAESAG